MVPIKAKNSTNNIIWSLFQDLLEKLEKVGSFVGSIFGENRAKKEVKKLEARLREIPNVEDVLIIQSNLKNLHETTFKIIANVDFYAAREIEEKALDLVIDTEWELCDFYKTENWHFRTQVINNADFSFAKIQ